jgi:uncharacterized protein YdeI (BOF family)
MDRLAWIDGVYPCQPLQTFGKESVMKRVFTSLALVVTALTAMVAFDASADEGTIRSLPAKGNITISGTVQDVQSEREFTLRDDSGTIDVSIKSNKSAVIAKGDNVTVKGKMESGMLGKKYIAASDVKVGKDLTSSISDAIEAHTSISLENAKKAKIASLPEEGLVKIAGTVDDVKDEKNFTVKDTTGSINVSIESDENVVLTKDAAVTVIGFVDKGLLGKSILAKHVIITADAGNMAPAAGSSMKTSMPKEVK